MAKQKTVFVFVVVLTVPLSMWDLSSPNRNQIHIPCMGSTES